MGDAVQATELLLERDTEVARIRRVVEHAGAGHGQILVIEGPSGIGKTRLLRAAVAIATHAGLDCLEARAGEFEREHAFGLALRLLEHRVCGSQASNVQLRGLATLAAPLFQPSSPSVLGRAATNDRFSLVRGLYWTVANLAEAGPISILIDDVQWADGPSLQFLSFLADRIEDVPIALVLALRTGEPTADTSAVQGLTASAPGECLRPVELSLSAVRDLVGAAGLGPEIDERIAGPIWAATRGNPFLVKESLVDVVSTHAEWSVTEPSRLSEVTPQSVSRRVVQRLDALGPDATAIAQACAVLGDDPPLPRVARVAGLDLAAATSAAERLQRAQILTHIDPVTFVHPMIRAAAHSALPADRRAHMHSAAARELYADGSHVDAVAEHLMTGTVTDDPWIREVLHQGAHVAARRGAPTAAVRYLRKALELTPPERSNPDLLIDLGLVEAATGETSSLSRLQRALTMIERPTDQARVLHALGQTLYRYGRNWEAAATFRRGAALVRQADPHSAAQLDSAFVSVALFSRDLHQEVIERLDEIAVPLVDRELVSTSDRALLAMLAVHRVMSTPPAADGLPLLRRALGCGQLLREQTSDSIVLFFATVALMCCGELEEAHQMADEVLADARARGTVLAVPEAATARSLVSYARGRIDEAISDARTAIEGMSSGWHSAGVIPQAMLATCMIERGELVEAESVLRSAESVLTRPEFGVQNAHFRCARGLLRLQQSEAAAALEDFLIAGRELQAAGVLNPAIAWRAPAALAAHRCGDTDMARALAEEEVALADEFALAAPLGAGLRVSAEISGGREGLGLLQDAVAVLEDSGAELELARALVDLGVMQRQSGTGTACRRSLRRGLDLSHRCGANALERRARDELAASGARPRRTAISGLESLTSRERRIAELAAQGRSNRSIADSLFLTRATVAWHLGNVYRKLDVSTRSALPDALRPVSH